jgi:hypothetical protein
MIPNSERNAKIKEFIAELTGFASAAENALKKIEADPHANKGEFHQFSEMMFTIRGTAMQLALPTIAEMAGLGEEIAVKGPGVEKGSMIKKCIGALWDTMTTLKHLLMHESFADETFEDSTKEEQDILKNRLHATIRSLGGPREQVSADEIERLLRGEG